MDFCLKNCTWKIKFNFSLLYFYSFGHFMETSLPSQTMLSFNFRQFTENNSIDFTEYQKETLGFCHLWKEGTLTFSINTSGSTGKPKKIIINRSQMVVSAEATLNYLGLDKGDSALVCLHTGYIAGKMMLVRGFLREMKMEIIPPVSNPVKYYTPDRTFDFISMVPFQLHTILEETPEKVAILNKCKAILIGGAPLSFELEQKANVITAPVFCTYGMTETVSHIALRPVTGPNRSNVFATLPNIEIGTDERGCLTVKAEVTNYKKLITNDLVKIVGEGHFIWIGRADNTINSGGVKIQIEILENSIEQIFSSLKIKNRFFIAPVPDATFGTVVGLLIEGDMDELKEKQVLNLLKEKLTRYEFPKKTWKVEKFSETPNGKIDRISTKALVF